jgi:SWI/SNF-related matrix-associated actin-dependent regulator 1 of chromatin subfamily A
MQQPKVVMRAVNGRVVIEPSGGLGPHFDRYRLACSGADYEGSTKTWHAKPEVAMRISSRLAEAGFLVILTAEVRALVEGEVADVRSSVSDARKRLDFLTKKIRAKGRTLFGYQKRGIIWMSSRKRVVNCDDMGLGKTAQSLCAIPSADDVGVLVICPSIAKGVWKREVAIWREDFAATVLSGRGSFRWPKAGEMVVINYDILPDSPPALPAGHEVVLVADEAHYLKNYKSQRTRKVQAISEKVARTIFLTGTPLPSRPDDLWTVLSVAGVAREAFGSWKEYLRLFSGRKDQWGGITWGSPLPEVGDRLKTVLIRRMKKDVLTDLPDKMYRLLEVEIGAEQEKKLDAEIQKLGPEVWRATDIGDIPFEKFAKTRALLAKAKEDAALEVIEGYEESQTPVVVFSAHRYVIDRLAARPGWAVITGDTKPSDRTAIEEAFQRGEYLGIGATIGAASTALTLTRATHGLFVDLSFVPADNSQAEDRIYRLGQTKGVLITHMVSSHPLDHHVRALIARKMGIIEGSVEKARGEKDVSDEEIEALLPKAYVEPKSDPKNPRREARTAEEKRAASVVMRTAGVCDGAKSSDGKGFSASHQRMGRGLALELLATGKLTDAQWRSCCWFGRAYGKGL